jgi:hypothetical protein
MASLRIVWRNPKRRQNHRRWRVAKGVYQGLYVVEELVSPEPDLWASILVLAVVGSSQPAARHEPHEPKEGKRKFGLGRRFWDGTA